MNVANLDRLIKAIEDSDESSIDLSYYIYNRELESGSKVIEDIVEYVNKTKTMCGTIYCVAGLATSLCEPDQLIFVGDNDHILCFSSSARSFLDLSSPLAAGLFSSASFRETEVFGNDKEIALARLRFLKENPTGFKYDEMCETDYNRYVDKRIKDGYTNKQRTGEE